MGLYLTSAELDLIRGKQQLKRAQAVLAQARRGYYGLSDQPFATEFERDIGTGLAQDLVCIAIDKVANYQRLVQADRNIHERRRRDTVHALFGIVT